MARAEKAAEIEGGPLGRLMERIAEAAELPPARGYQAGAGDPLERLRARIRGEEVDLPAEPGAQRGAGEPDARARDLGRALESSLAGRPLAGPVRAEVAARLAALMQGPLRAEVEPIWELVVFAGEGGSGFDRD